MPKGIRKGDIYMLSQGSIEGDCPWDTSNDTKSKRKLEKWVKMKLLFLSKKASNTKIQQEKVIS